MPPGIVLHFDAKSKVYLMYGGLIPSFVFTANYYTLQQHLSRRKDKNNIEVWH